MNMKKHLLLAIVVLATTALMAQTQGTIPQGTEIKVRTDTAIPAKPANGTNYSGTISTAVQDQNGNVVIPAGSRAQLVAETTPDGKDTNLDLRSVTVNGRHYALNAPGETTSSGTPGGLGANKRTAKYVGGGALVGTVLGAILGGGKGAALGAVLGGAGGAGAQVYTGRDKQIPAETVLSYKLAQNLYLQPYNGNYGPNGLQRRHP
jgi:hypothetical protein